jgi:hypothetical protein
MRTPIQFPKCTFTNTLHLLPASGYLVSLISVLKEAGCGWFVVLGGTAPRLMSQREFVEEL